MRPCQRYVSTQKIVLRIRNGFNADPDPAFKVGSDPNPDADSDADPDSWFRWIKMEENLNLKILYINIFDQKLQFYYPLASHKGCPS